MTPEDIAWKAGRWALKGRVCRECHKLSGEDGLPTQTPLPSRSRGDVSSFVMFTLDVCKGCDPRGAGLRAGRVIEFRRGLAFLSRDGELHIAVQQDAQWVVYAVNTDTLEQHEVARS